MKYYVVSFMWDLFSIVQPFIVQLIQLIQLIN